ncbi:MAG TPA: PIN domain-containing protein [Verrucomicrobiae bacterium]|nr:PIN domain-containing protein [Verrucomicrobiae bacterium]
MILVDTSVIVAWLDASHEHHKACWEALRKSAAEDELAISSVTFAELAAGGHTREFVDEQLNDFAKVDLDFESAWRAGRVFRQIHRGKSDSVVLPDFFIRAQAAVIGCRHLTNDRRRLTHWPDVDFVFP